LERLKAQLFADLTVHSKFIKMRAKWVSSS